MEKFKQKEESEKLVDELDKNFMSLVDSRVMESLTRPFEVDEDKKDTYKNLLNAMSMDIRARPSERTKEPEEISQKEQETLEDLELCFFQKSFTIKKSSYLVVLPRIIEDVPNLEKDQEEQECRANIGNSGYL